VCDKAAQTAYIHGDLFLSKSSLTIVSRLLDDCWLTFFSAVKEMLERLRSKLLSFAALSCTSAGSRPLNSFRTRSSLQ